MLKAKGGGLSHKLSISTALRLAVRPVAVTGHGDVHSLLFPCFGLSFFSRLPQRAASGERIKEAAGCSQGKKRAFKTGSNLTTVASSPACLLQQPSFLQLPRLAILTKQGCGSWGVRSARGTGDYCRSCKLS
jgi:hypothetical protein